MRAVVVAVHVRAVRRLLQDVFSICLGVMFLQVVRLGSIKVAATLLCAAFAYDVFFVFISPLVFGSSS